MFVDEDGLITTLFCSSVITEKIARSDSGGTEARNDGAARMAYDGLRR
jgi:hypothetical protein